MIWLMLPSGRMNAAVFFHCLFGSSCFSVFLTQVPYILLTQLTRSRDLMRLRLSNDDKTSFQSDLLSE